MWSGSDITVYAKGDASNPGSAARRFGVAGLLIINHPWGVRGPGGSSGGDICYRGVGCMIFVPKPR